MFAEEVYGARQHCCMSCNDRDVRKHFIELRLQTQLCATLATFTHRSTVVYSSLFATVVVDTSCELVIDK